MNERMNSKIIKLAVLLTFFFIGVCIRNLRNSGELVNNLSAFYYARTNFLVQNNAYPIHDTNGFAPTVYIENYPPFLSYFTYFIYLLVKIFTEINIYTFVVYYPLIVFALIFVSGFFITKKIFNLNVAIFFTGFLSLTPLSISLTRPTLYTEESLGVLLFLTTFYFLIKSKENCKNLLLAIASLTLLSLTWQMFLFFDILLLLLIFFNLKKFNLVKKYLLILVLPILMAHFISIYIIGIKYSPIGIFYETYLTFKLKNDLNYNIVFSPIFTNYRADLTNITFQNFIDSYSPLSLILFPLGMFISLINFRKDSYRITLLAAFLSLIFIIFLEKLRYSMLPFVLIMNSIALQYAYEKISKVRRLKIKNIRRFLKQKIEKIFHNKIILFSIIMVSVLILIIVFYLITKIPKPYVEISAPEKLELGKDYNVTVKLTNLGEDSLCFSGHNGLHIEVENAFIKDIKSVSDFTYAWVPYKGYSNNITWFETKYTCILKGQSASAEFIIEPVNLPVNIYYRAWMPQLYCLYGVPLGMNPKYAAAWRNEKCLHRFPLFYDEECKVPVFAGYTEKQYFSCARKTIG